MSRTQKSSAKGHNRCMMSRRDFLLYSSAATAVSMVPITLFAGTGQETNTQARVVGYPRQKIAKLSELTNHEPKYFHYPDKGPNSVAMLVKTDVACGGGIGVQRDIVAFSMTCTHQGGPLAGAYKAVDEHRVVGQCPFHLSTFSVAGASCLLLGSSCSSSWPLLGPKIGPDRTPSQPNIIKKRSEK